MRDSTGWQSLRILFATSTGKSVVGLLSSEEKIGGEGGIRTSQARQSKSFTARAFDLLLTCPAPICN
jgi:hypothetical protein